MAVTTDIIVGFPGETEEDFQQTLEMLDLVQFDLSYSYAFSSRPGTAAAEMEEFMTQEEKLRRLQVWQARQEVVQGARLQQWVGRTVDVLIDSYNRKDDRCVQGRISQNFVVNFLEPHPGLSLGSIVKAKITGKKRYTLMGELVVD